MRSVGFRNMLTTSILLIFVDQFIPTAALILWPVKRRYKRQLDWIIHFLFSAFFISFIFTTGRWDLVGNYLLGYPTSRGAR